MTATKPNPEVKAKILDVIKMIIHEKLAKEQNGICHAQYEKYLTALRNHC